MSDIYDRLLDGEQTDTPAAQPVAVPTAEAVAQEPARAPAPIAEVETEQPDVYDSLLDKDLQARDQQVRASLDQALSVIPERAATTQALAKATGLPEDLVERNFDAVQKQAKAQALQSLMARSPILARQMSDPTFAKLAHNDAENLSGIEKVFAALKETGRAGMAGLYSMNEGLVGLAQVPFDVAAPLLDPLAGTVLPENLLRRVGGGLSDYRKRIGAMSEAAMPRADGIMGAGYYSGIASLTRNLAALPLAFISPQMALGVMVAPVAGEEYGKARDKGVNLPFSLGYGASQAVVEYATEKLPLTKLMGDLKHGSSFATTLLRQIAYQIPGEQIATVLQDMNEWAVIHPQKTAREYLAERPSAAAQTLIATVVGTGGQVTVMKGIDAVVNRNENKARDAEAGAQAIEQINQLAAASQLLKVSPETFEQFIENAAEEGPVQGVFIDANVLLQSGVAEQLAAVSPSVAEQIQVAAATGGTVQIPVAEYAARIAPTEYAQGLLDHLKTAPDGFSRAEAREYMQTQAEALQAEVEQRIAQQEGIDEFRASQQRVKDLVQGELNELGRFTESKNELDATLIAARTAVRAAQLGMTPEQMFERQRVQFAAQRMGEQGFDQGAPQSLGDVRQQWDEAGIDAFVSERNGTINLSKIIVPQNERSTGKGTQAMQSLVDYADRTGQRITLSPSTDFGGTKSRLVQFYKRFGFVENKGRNKDYEISETMYRPAQEFNQTPALSEDDYIAHINPTGRRLEESDRPTVYAGDIEGAMPMDAQRVKGTFSTRDGAPVEVYRDPENGAVWAKVDGQEAGYATALSNTEVDLSVAQEFQGQGIGSILSTEFRRANPFMESGGLTEAGERTARAAFRRLQADGVFEQYNQGQRGPRGFFNPETNTIGLLKNADLSTFLHEAGHYFFESDIALAGEITRANRLFGMESATEGERQIVNDVSALLRWHGLKGDISEQLATWAGLDFEEKRTYHERTAESFERYLFEGKAPSIELQSYFQQFRAWLLNVYRGLKNFIARHPEAGQLSDEVRSIFDRMLATNEEIQLAEQGRSMLPLFRTQAEADNIGMTPEEFAAYQAQDPQATQDAVQDLQARGLRDLQWARNARNKEIKKLQRQAAELRRQARIEVRREVMSQPVYRAWQFLTRKLDPEDRITPVQRPKSVAGAVDPTVDSLLVAVAKLGGLKKSEAISEWGMDPAERPESGIFGMPVLRATEGHSIDAMRDLLSQYGYVDRTAENPREFEDKFDAELRGDSQYSNQVDAQVFMTDEGLAGEHITNLSALGGGRLDLQSLRDKGFTEDQINVLKARKMTAREGLHPDLVADLPGIQMEAGDALVRALLEADPPSEAIEALTDARMLEQHGELATPEAIEREADKAIHNEARARMVATEANALAKATGQRRILAPAAKQFAEAMVARSKVRDMRPSLYANAAARAGKAAEQASRAGDLPQATAEKRTQLVNTYATRAAYDAREQIDRALRYLSKFDSEGARKGLDAEYLEQIDTLLERFDLRRGQSLRAIDKRTALAQWVAQQEQDGIEPDIPSYLIHEANRTHYKDLPVEEFRGLVDAVRQIEHLGRLKKKLLTAKDQRELDAIVDEIKDSMEQASEGRIVDNERRDTLASRLTHVFRGAEAAHRKAASIVRELDGFTDAGPMWEYFTRTMNEAGDREAVMRAEAAKRLQELSKPVLAGEAMGGKGRLFPSLGRYLNRGERLAIALNWGNESNRQRLVGGKGWTETQLQPVLDSLTQAEWTFVQNVWDFFESYRPQIAAKERRVYGKEPDWIEPAPFTVRTADGAEVQVRGGYYPIKYDPNQSGKAGEFAQAEEAKAMMRAAYTAATTRRSFTKTRAEEVKGRPLLLTFDGIWQGANEVIHDLAWHEWLIDANKLLRRLDSPIRTHFGAEYVNVLRNTIKDTARGDIPAANTVERSLNHIRTGATVAGLGWNLTTALLQPLGITQSIIRVGGKHIASGLAQYYGSPLHMAEKAREVRAKSGLMENRALTMNREINDVRNRLAARSDWKLRLEASFFVLIQKVQAGVDYPTWLGAYEKAIEAGQPEDRAIALADQAVIDSQGGGQIKDLAQVQRGHPAMKLFTNFYSYFNTLMNLTAEQTRKRVQAKQYAALAGDYVLLMILPAVLGALLRDVLKGEDDEDEYLKNIASELVGYPLGMFVGVRELAGAAQSLFGVSGPFDYSGPAGLRVIGEMERLAKQIDQGDLDMALFKAANNTAGILFHYPAGQVNRLVEGVAGLIEGKTTNPLAPFAGYAK